MASRGGEKAMKLRAATLDKFFPGWRKELWHPSEELGFACVPRTLALLTVLTKLLTKDEDPSRVYLDLWCRNFGDCLIDVRDEKEFAYACGLTASRGVRSWRERVKLLKEYGFIRTEKRWDQDFYWIFLRHPDTVVQELDERGKIPDPWKQEYERRMAEIGAKRWKLPRKEKPVPKSVPA